MTVGSSQRYRGENRDSTRTPLLCEVCRSFAREKSPVARLQQFLSLALAARDTIDTNGMHEAGGDNAPRKLPPSALSLLATLARDAYGAAAGFGSRREA